MAKQNIKNRFINSRILDNYNNSEIVGEIELTPWLKDGKRTVEDK